MERKIFRYFSWSLVSFSLFCSFIPLANAAETSEYRLKVAFLYNFIAYTRWPEQSFDRLTICIHGDDPFGDNVQHLRSNKVNGTDLVVQYTKHVSEFSDCQAIFISRSAWGNLESILIHLKNKPVLTISDDINAARQGVMINMMITEDKINFNVNLNAARNANLEISAQLLRLAKEVFR